MLFLIKLYEKMCPFLLGDQNFDYSRFLLELLVRAEQEKKIKRNQIKNNILKRLKFQLYYY